MLPRVKKEFREAPMPDTPQRAPQDTADDPGSAIGPHDTPEGSRPPDGAPLELSSLGGRGRGGPGVGGLRGGGGGLPPLPGRGATAKTRLASAVAFEAVEGFED